jgi:uncharacterized membrane protein YfcA
VLQLFVVFSLSVAAGGFGALVGIGGGIVIVPVLSILVGVPIRIAIAASLIGVIATSTAAAAPYLDRGIADRRVGLVLLVATAAGGVTGGITSAYVDARVLSGLFGGVLALVVVQMVRTGLRGADDEPAPVGESAGWVSSYVEPRSGREVAFRVRRPGLGVAISVVAGNISGLLGVGGGVINVPTMHVLMGVPLRVATATSTYMLGATAVASGMIYYSRGQIDALVAAPVALGVFLGARGGARIATRVPQQVLRWAFVGIAIVFAIQMLARSVGIA